MKININQGHIEGGGCRLSIDRVTENIIASSGSGMGLVLYGELEISSWFNDISGFFKSAEYALAEMFDVASAQFVFGLKGRKHCEREGRFIFIRFLLDDGIDVDHSKEWCDRNLGYRPVLHKKIAEYDCLEFISEEDAIMYFLKHTA